jgi:probable rRNA maturation factor
VTDAVGATTGDRERVRSLYLGAVRVDLTIRVGVASPVPGVGLARALVAGLEAGGAPLPASIGLVLSNDAELAELNEAHLGEVGPTDVLSFPLLPPEAFPDHAGKAGGGVGSGGGRESGAGSGELGFVLPPERRPHLGDIVVSVERAVAQAGAGAGGQTGDIRWSAADELRLLVVHGALHICGWDHAEPVEEAAMRSLERQVLAGLASPRASR